MIASFIGGGYLSGGFGFVPPNYNWTGTQFGFNNGTDPAQRHTAKLILLALATTATGAEDFSGPVGTSNTNPTIVVTDNQGNTYVALPPTIYNAGTPSAVQHQFVYCLNPTMVWTPTSFGGGEEALVNVLFTGVIGQMFAVHMDKFSGVASELTQVLATLASGSSVSTGAVTPTRYGSLIYTGLASKGAVTSGTDHLSPTGYVVDPSGSNVILNGSRGYHPEVVNTLVPITHTWFWTGTHAPACMGTVIFAPMAAPMPDVVGMTAAAATAAITADGFAIGKITGGVGALVVTQVPEAGALVPIKDPTATFPNLWKVDLTLGATAVDCVVMTEDWSDGNSLFTSMEDYVRSSDGVDSLYPAIEAAYGVTVADGALVASAAHADWNNFQVEFAHMGPLYGGGGGSLTSYYGSPGFWPGQDGAVEFTYTPTTVTVAQNSTLVNIEDYSLYIDYERAGYTTGQPSRYWIQGYGWNVSSPEGYFLPDATVAGVSYRFRLEWRCSSGPYTGVPATDGYLRVYRDGVLVFEQVAIDLYINGNSTTPDNLIHTVIFGNDGFGALDDVVIACAAYVPEVELPEVELASDIIGLTWVEYTLEVPPIFTPTREERLKE